MFFSLEKETVNCNSEDIFKKIEYLQAITHFYPIPIAIIPAFEWGTSTASFQEIVWFAMDEVSYHTTSNDKISTGSFLHQSQWWQLS